MRELVTYERRDTVSTIVMDDSGMNVLSVAMLQALNAALDHAQADGAAIMLAGREGVFSAGFDLAVFKRGKDEQVRMLTAGARTVERLLAFPAPVVAACGGHAIAMGAFLLLAADIRLGVSNGAFKIAVNEVAIGLTVPRFATEVCRQRLTPAYFNRAVITAEHYDPHKAVEAGFLDELVPAAELFENARNATLALATLDRKALVATKLRAREGVRGALRHAIEADIQEWNSRLG
jgi:enoyl-CoA hydratase/carnithine racemase